jgi:biopolymer transport protein ExbD
MSWSVRHEGSPRAVEGLSLDEVLHGLEEGRWEPTDEVRGPGEVAWQPLETHPATAEAAGEVEPPPPRHFDDGTHLDFTALIDVCLVLLIFFIMTVSVAAMQPRLRSPEVTAERVEGLPVVTREKIDQQMIRVSVKMEGGKPVIRVEDKEVARDKFKDALKNLARGTKTALLLEYDDDVPHGAVVAVQDAARGARLESVFVVVPGKARP